MQRLFKFVFTCLALAWPGSAQAQLSPFQFTEECAAEFKAAAPHLKPEIVGALELRLVFADGRAGKAYLHNVYAEYRQDPRSMDRLIASYVRNALAGMADERDVDPARVVPVVRPRAWLAVGDLARRDSMASPSDVVFDTLADDLIVAYGEDRPNYIRYVVATDLKKAGIQRDKLRTLAIENLRQILGRVRFLEIGGNYRADAGGVYEASLLLLPDMWTRDRFRVRGKIIVAVPTRDLLLVTGSEDAKGLASIRAIVKDRFDRGAYGISPNLYVYRDGKLTRFADQ